MTKTTTFISYSHQDDAFVATVTQLLRTQGSDLFFDKDSIKPGEKWSDRIDKSIRESDQIMVFWCCHSADSEWVVRETLMGMALQKPIIPILCCDFPVSPSISEFQWISFKDVLKHRCKGDATHTIAIPKDEGVNFGKPETPQPANTIPEKKIPHKRHAGSGMLYAILGILIALATLITYFWLTRRNPGTPNLEIKGADAFIAYTWPVLLAISVVTLIVIVVRKKRLKKATEVVYPELAEADDVPAATRIQNRGDVINEKVIGEKLEDALRKVSDNPFNYYPRKP